MRIDLGVRHFDLDPFDFEQKLDVVLLLGEQIHEEHRLLLACWWDVSGQHRWRGQTLRHS